MLAIVWANEFNPNNQFDEVYDENEAVARAIVNRAIDDWEAVIQDFNYDGNGNPATDTSGNNNTLTLDIIATPQTGTNRGRTVQESLVFFQPATHIGNNRIRR